VLSAVGLAGSFRGRGGISGFSADFAPGVTAVIAPEDAGSSALLGMLAGACRPEAGDILYNGASIGALRGDYLNAVGYMPLKLELPRSNTVEGTLMHMAAVRGLNRVFARERTEYMLDLFGLAGSRTFRLGDCSADTLRRVGIAQAMLPDPEVLLLDGPTLGLLGAERMRFVAILSALPKNRITVFTTPDAEDAGQGVDSVLVMADGKCLLQAPRGKLIACLEGRVWRVAVPLDEAFSVKLNSVVSAQQKVFKGLQLRIVAEQAPDAELQAAPEEPELRDAYAYCLARGPEALLGLMASPS